MPFEKLKAPFLRVLGIAVQGLMNASPKRTVSSLPVSRRIEVRVFRLGGDTLIYDLLLRPALKGGLTVLSYHISRTSYPTRKWMSEMDSRNRVEMSRAAVERIVSTIFTPPYPVGHVSDEAIAAAAKMLADAEKPKVRPEPEE